MIDIDQLPDLRPLVDPFKLDIITDRLIEKMQRIEKQDSAIETCIYLHEHGIPLEEVLALSKRLGTTHVHGDVPVIE